MLSYFFFVSRTRTEVATETCGEQTRFYPQLDQEPVFFALLFKIPNFEILDRVSLFQMSWCPQSPMFKTFNIFLILKKTFPGKSVGQTGQTF